MSQSTFGPYSHGQSPVSFKGINLGRANLLYITLYLPLASEALRIFSGGQYDNLACYEL